MLMQDIEVKLYRSYIKIPVIFFVPAAIIATLWVLLYFYVNSTLFLDTVEVRFDERLPGSIEVTELMMEPTFTRVHVFGATISDPEGEPVIIAEEVHAEINPLLLLMRRIQVNSAVARGSGVKMRIDDDGVNLLRALGLDQTTEEPDTSEPLVRGVSLNNLSCDDCYYSLDIGFMDFDVPRIDVPHGDIDIGEKTLVMSVPELDVDEVNFRFMPDLFRFDEEAGPWTFTVEETRIRNWKWANDGFSVESLHMEVDDVVTDVTGYMRFPPSGEDEPARMIYGGSGRLSTPYWSPVGQYFLQDHVHAEVPEVNIAVEGSLEEIEGGARFDVDVLDTGGLITTDLRGAARLHDELVMLEYAEARVHGGLVEMPYAYFNMFTGQFGGEFSFVDVNPHTLVGDFGFDYPWLSGQASGSVAVRGHVPRDPLTTSPDDPSLELVESAIEPIVTVDLIEDMVLRRDASDVIPGERVTIRKGGRVWADLDRVGIPNAKIDLDAARLDVSRFVFDREAFELQGDDRGRPLLLRIESADVEPLLAAYGLEGISGELAARLEASGRINYPTLDLDANLKTPVIRASDVTVRGEHLKTAVHLEDGRLTMKNVDFSSPRGSGTMTGWLDVLRDPGGVIDPETRRTTTDFLGTRRHDANLDFEVDALHLALLEPFLGVPLQLEGRGYATGHVENSLERPVLDLTAHTEEASALGQPFPRIELEATSDEQRVDVTRFEVDAGKAGELSASGHVGYDQTYAFEAVARDLELAHIVPLAEAMPFPLHGTGEVFLHGEGSIDDPGVAGDLRVKDLSLAGRKIGDVALVTNTLDDNIHVVGALLPWVTIDAEIPLDEDSPYYARLGLDHLELTAAVPELKSLRFVDEAEATGTVELFMDRDLSRYQVLANLSDIRVDSLGQEFRNRGPVIVGLNNGELLQIQQATIGARDRFVSARGGIFLDQALLDLNLEGKLDLALLNSFRLTFPEFFPESFLESQGMLTIDASVRGPPGGLVADGFVDFGPSQILIRGLSDPLRVLSGRVQFGGDGIRVEREEPLRGRVLGGVYSLVGELGFDGGKPHDLLARVWSHNMSYRIPEVANLTFDTALSFAAKDLDRPESWKLSGKIDILDGLYYEDISIFQKQFTNRVLGAFNRKTEKYEASIIEQVPALEEMSFDVALHARDGFRIQNEIDRLELDLELRIGVRLQNTLTDPRLTGDIDVIDGKVDFQGETFEVRNGTLSFYGDPDKPYVDLVADADVRNRCRQPDIASETSSTMTLTGIVESGEQKSYHVILNVRGPLDNMDIQFESVPYADQRDILSLLLTGCTVDQLTASSASSPTLEVALGPVLGWIEGQVQEEVGVEEFTITPSVDRLQASIGDTLTRRLSWRLRLDTGLTEADGGQQYQLEYRLSDQWSAQLSESSRSDTNNFLIDLKLKYRLFLE